MEGTGHRRQFNRGVRGGSLARLGGNLCRLGCRGRGGRLGHRSQRGRRGSSQGSQARDRGSARSAPVPAASGFPPVPAQVPGPAQASAGRRSTRVLGRIAHSVRGFQGAALGILARNMLLELVHDLGVAAGPAAAGAVAAGHLSKGLGGLVADVLAAIVEAVQECAADVTVFW